MRELYENNRTIKDNRRKVCLFFLMLSVTVSVILRTGYTQLCVDGIWDFNSFPLLLTGILISPMLTLYFIRQKGIYSACILLIFLSATALMCASFYEKSLFMNHLGHAAMGILIPCSIITLPLLMFYLIGPIDYFLNVCRGYVFLGMGLITYFPLEQIPHDGEKMQVLIILTYFLLAISFFTVFSAWSHRLVLLK